MAETKAPAQRPLSPHLQVYRLTLSMMMSGAHRITGIALYLGTLLMVWWLIAAAAGPKAYADVQWFMGTIIGRLVLFGFTWALIHHALGGMRHLIWDMGYAIDKAGRDRLVFATIAGSVALTLLLWIIGFMVIGGGTP
jgi:succinate dehydrogenase / fumarate reductase cytochrome b subunit